MLTSALLGRLRPLVLRRATLFVAIEVVALLCRRHLQADLSPFGGGGVALAALGPMSWAFLANDRLTYRSPMKWPNDKLLRYLRFCTCSSLGLLIGLTPMLLTGKGQSVLQRGHVISAVVEIVWDYASTAYTVW